LRKHQPKRQQQRGGECEAPHRDGSARAGGQTAWRGLMRCRVAPRKHQRENGVTWLLA
jgi:hypothetical protein